MNRLVITFFLFLSAFYSSQIFAKCTNSTTSTRDNYNALINFGVVNLDSAYLEPVGTLLGSTVVPATNYNYNGANAESIVWTCDAEDLPSLQYLVATNGDDRVGGWWDMGGSDGIPTDTYATFFAYVGLRQTISGVTISRYWKAIPLTTYEEVNGKINIRLKDIPPIYAEIYRLGTLVPASGSRNHYCGTGTGLAGLTDSGTYTCNQPNSYISLQGPGLNYDEVGADSAYSYDFWGSNNGLGYGMHGANSISSVASCVARSATPLVLFSTIAESDLNNGLTVQNNFNVDIECNNTAKSGVNSGQTAIGFQVSSGALSAAQNLGLINSTSGVSALLSDNYGSEGIAKGVGIYLTNANSGENMIFVGEQYANSGAASGWYPVLSGVENQGIDSAEAGYKHYTHTFTATLKKLEGGSDDVAAGQVKSTVAVVVKVQ